MNPRLVSLRHSAFVLALLLITANPSRGEITISTDFEGGSAKVVSIDQPANMIRFMPGGDPARGWPCWWFLRADGAPRGATIRFELVPSDAPIPQEGGYKGRPLPFFWAAASRAAVSFDGRTWTQTAAGAKDSSRIIYTIEAPGGPIWLAWGPPFTPRDTAALAKREGSSGIWTPFELSRTHEGRAVTALHLGKSDARPAVWIQARQHAWESGGSWVCAGFIEWAAGADPLAGWLRDHAEIVAVPIMDVDHVTTGDGGKDALPQDHNRDWTAQPHWPEVAAAQKRLGGFAQQHRLEVFVDLHNPGPSDRTFFYISPGELLAPDAAKREESFLAIARTQFVGPIPFDQKVRETGAKYHPLWRQISKNWIRANAAPESIALTLENAWNTPASTIDGYKTNGAQLGRTIALYLQQLQKSGTR